MLGADLSVPLTVIALVSHYLTNKLIVRRPLLKRIAAFTPYCYGDYRVLANLSASYSRLQGMFLRVTNPFATPLRSSLRLSYGEQAISKKIACASEALNKVKSEGAYDLHALSTPPAFILSQDQTLIKNIRD